MLINLKRRKTKLNQKKLQQILALSTSRLELPNIKNVGKIKSMFANII